MTTPGEPPHPYNDANLDSDLRTEGGYIFIHRMLMERFAGMDEERIKMLTQEIIL